MRIPDEEWEDLDAAAKSRNPPTDRATVVREFIRWYLRRPSAKLPTRPTAEEVAAIEADRTSAELEQ